MEMRERETELTQFGFVLAGQSPQVLWRAAQTPSRTEMMFPSKQSHSPLAAGWFWSASVHPKPYLALLCLALPKRAQPSSLPYSLQAEPAFALRVSQRSSPALPVQILETLVGLLQGSHTAEAGLRGSILLSLPAFSSQAAEGHVPTRPHTDLEASLGGCNDHQLNTVLQGQGGEKLLASPRAGQCS